MAYNHPYNPDELPRFAEPEQKGGAQSNAGAHQTYASPVHEHHRSPPPQQQNFRPQPRPQPQPQYHQTSPPPQQQNFRHSPSPHPPVSPHDPYYRDRPGPSLPSGPRPSAHNVPPPRSPLPPRSPAPGGSSVVFKTGQDLSREQLIRLFRDLDKDARGFITEAQLAQTLVNGDSTKFNPVTVSMMVRMFDSNRNGELEFEEFSGLWRFLEKWCEIFNKFDVDHSGTISLDEFKAALVSFQYRLSDVFVDFIFHIYDSGRKGVITFDIFMQSCITLKRMTDIFKKYDDDRDGFIIISFEDFVTEFLRQLQKMSTPLTS